ncbi:MAG: PQQ-binding-like beta-propeller repeat protein [Phycisphaeraceae bacterium]
MPHRPSAGLWRKPLALFTGALLLLPAMVVTVEAEIVLGGGRRVMMLQEEETVEVSTTNGASLPTDSRIDDIIKGALKFTEEGRFDLAVVAWQDILDKGSSVLRTSDGVRYTAVQYFVESQLARLATESPDGLREYRLKADGEARALIAQAVDENEEQALSQVVRRYFFSSLGDDAAYALGLLMLDRHEFVAATRHFLSIVQRHPDYTLKTDTPGNIARAEILLRLAAAAARSGDGTTAKAALELLSNEGHAARSPQVVAWIRDTIKSGGGPTDVAKAAGEWTMSYGTAARDGLMFGLPADTQYTGVWQDLWSQPFSSGFGMGTGAQAQAPQPITRSSRIAVNSGLQPVGNEADQRKQTSEKWGSSNWIPADQLLLHDGKVYFRAYDGVGCVDARTGKQVFMPGLRRVKPQVRPMAGSTAEHVMLFGDRAASSMSIADGVLYYLEDDQSMTRPNQNQFFRWNGIAAYPPMHGNRIVALEARTGKLQWERAGETDQTGTRAAVRYQSAPVPYGNLLITPVYENESLCVYARYADRRGELAWRTELADQPDGGWTPWTTTGLSVAGGDVYLCAGGVVFTLDATTGLVRWAVRYERAITPGPPRNYGGQAGASPLGFSEDFLTPHGRAVIVLPHDGKEIVAYDRRTGAKLWWMDRDDGEHTVLGTYGNRLYTFGTNLIISRDMASGRELARVTTDYAIHGRGFIADDAVYIPADTAIFRFSLNLKEKPLSAVGTALNVNDSKGEYWYRDYVGNIFSDGERIYGVGLERVYALGTVKEPIEAGLPSTTIVPPVPVDGPAGDLLAAHGIEKNAESLTAYFKSLHPTAEEKKRIATLIDQLGDDDFRLRKDAERVLITMAVVPIEFLNRAYEEHRDPHVRNVAKSILDQTAGKQTRILYQAMTVIAKEKIKGLAAPVLSAMPLCAQQYLRDALGRALVATATEDDAPMLIKALTDEAEHTRAMATMALGSGLKEKARPQLVKMFSDKSEKVKLASARALANLGDRQSLAMLVALLESEEIQTRNGAIRTLAALTGQQMKFISYDKPENRQASIVAWKEWIATTGLTAELKFPISETRFLLGRTLYTNYRLHRVAEVDSEGKEVWSQQVQNPWGCVGLPNGHRLVTSYTGRSITEYDAEGNQVWQQTNLPSAPFRVERLENGNTLVACSNSHKVVEVNPANEVVWDKTINGRPTDARRLANGNTLIALQNGRRVIEVDPEGKEVWAINNLGSPISAERLSNGNTLVSEPSNHSVREFDPDGKEVWSTKSLPNALHVQTPYDATRLENGNTLIGDNTGLREVDPKGTVITTLKQEQGISSVSRY